MDRKEAFSNLLKERGYSSLHDFCVTERIDYANMNKRVNGVRQKIELSYMFKLANILHVPVERLIEIFYPEELAENRSLIEE